MAALGAVPLLRARAEALIDREAASRRKEQGGLHAREAAAGAVEACALAGVGAVAAASGSDAPTVAFIVLLTVAVLESARRLGHHIAALRAARAARLRLVASEADDPQDDDGARAALALVRPGGTLLVTGASGVGKTTLLQRMADAADTRVVLVELDDPLFTGTVAGNLRLGNPALSETETTRLLAVFGLADVRPSDRTGVDGRDLSGGELGRLRIARAVAADPPLLLVDEPLSGLDPETGRRVLAAVRTFLPDARIVYALHEAVPLTGASVLALSGPPSIAEPEEVWSGQ
jgi:ATP-binding cassette subfamily C protein CydC